MKWSNAPTINQRTYKAVVVNCEDILLLRHHVAKAAASRVLEGNAGGLGTQNPVDVIAVIKLVVKAIGDIDGL